MEKFLFNSFISLLKKSNLFFLLLILLVPTSGYAQNQNIKLSKNKMTIQTVVREIEKQTSMSVDYGQNTLNPKSVIRVKSKIIELSDLLNAVLKDSNCEYKIIGRHIIITPKDEHKQMKSNSNQQLGTHKSITGRIVDAETGEPIIGANIRISGTPQGVTTDFDGNFKLQVPSDSKLEVSYIGYRNQLINASGASNFHIRLHSDTQSLNEVVVVGYGTMKKSDLTGSVSSVQSANFNKGLVTSPSQLLQGRTSGIVITNNGGEPGGGATIRVRGSNSIRSGQEPLYVIDGVPMDVSDNFQPTGATISGIGISSYTNPLNFINPDDIESISVLKDASSSAIYGARAANGVILITTKKGLNNNHTELSYTVTGSISYLPKKYDILNASEYRALVKSKGKNIEDGGSDIDWQDEIYRTSYSHNHNISLSSGNANGGYRASVNVQDDEGIIKRTGMKKYSGRFYFHQKFLNDRLNLEGTLVASRLENQRAPIGESGGTEGDLIFTALKINPTFPIYNSDGSYYQHSTDVRNPLAMINLTNDNTTTKRIMANVTATFELLKGLKYKFNYAIDRMTADRRVTQDKALIYVSDGGEVYINNVEQKNYLIENYLTYDFKVKDIHSFNLLAGHSYQKFRDYWYGFSETGFKIDNINYLYDLSYGKNSQITGTSDITLNELQSFFGRVNYNLMDKYLLTFNFRADGSTKFGSNNKYGFFPSAAFAWRMSEEKFIKQLNFFDNLKFRLSYGITGNQEIPNKISEVQLGSTTGAILNGGSTVTSGITLTRTPNPNLKWERTGQFNIGLDFSIFNNRLNGTIDWFNKTTKDVLLQAYSISPAPTTTVWSNIKDMKIINKGIEIGLNGVIVEHKNWGWTVGLNFSTIKNKVKNLPMSYITIATPSGPGLDGFKAQIIKSGYPIGTFWGYKYLGLDSNGKSIYEKDENGNLKQQCIGNAQPDFTLNLNTALRWKNLELSLFFNSVVGNDVYNNLGNVLDNLSMFAKGYNTTHSAANSNEALDNTLDYSSRYIEDGSYIRLSSASLKYTFPLRNTKWIKGLSMSLTGNNLFVITKYNGYDPEVDSRRTTNGIPSLGIGWTNYPMARSFSLGASVQF